MPAGILLDYIDQLELHPHADKTQMMLTALKAYYLPLAYLAVGKSRPEVERVGWDSVFALLRQVDYLCSVLGLDRRQFGGLLPMGLHPQASLAGNASQPLPPETEPPGNGSYNLAGLSAFEVVYSDRAED